MSTEELAASGEAGFRVSLGLPTRKVATETRRTARADHVTAAVSHDFRRDDTLPVWHGWHAFRRGLATNLHRLGVPDKIIQAILRHSNVAVTQSCYIKTVGADVEEAMLSLNQAAAAKKA